MRFLILLPVLFALGCAGISYTPTDCEADIELLRSIADVIIASETDDETKVEKRQLYTLIAARVAARGCTFIPLAEVEPE